MRVPARDVGALLPILRDENAREHGKGSRAQKIRAPEKLPARIPTLDGGGRPLSPMLRDTLEHARFAATATVEHVITALGKSVEPKIRRAVRAALKSSPV